MSEGEVEQPPRKLVLLAVTMPEDEAEEVKAEARAKRWPITMVLRERLKDGKRWRERQKEAEGR
jgi:hypothetical protein